jgi:hypothetical protein
MVAKQVDSEEDPDLAGIRDGAVAHWSRCEAALIGSRVTVAASDIDGRYTWIFNAPGELPGNLVGRFDHEVLTSGAGDKAFRGEANRP